MPAPTPLHTVISDSRCASTGSRVRIEDSRAWAPRRSRFHARFLVTCCEHGTQRHFTTHSDAVQAVRNSHSFCSSCVVRENREQRRSTRRAQAGQALGATRRFGVEFEFYGIRRRIVEDWLTTSGMRANGWKVVGDCSVTGEGLELVSPPLKGDDAGLAQLRVALEWLNTNGAKVNRTCGTHVHHDAADMGIDGIVRFVKTYQANTSLIDWLVSPSRRAAQAPTYCQGITQADVAYMDRCVAAGSRPKLPTRYKTVNLEAYPRHGTIEIRQHQGTLSYDKIVAWIKLGQAMMDAAKTRANPIGEQQGIRTLFDRLDVSEDAAAFLLGRSIQFNAPVSQVAA